MYLGFAFVDESNDATKSNSNEDGQECNDENQEEVMVVDANAVVDPGAVVVESFDAAVADGAVFGSGSPEHFAIGTHLAGVHFGEEFHEFEVGLYVAGVNYTRGGEGDGKNYGED